MDSRPDARASGWRGPLLAALVAVLAGLPGVFAPPPLDRDESRFAEATAQMLETGDFISVNQDDESRRKQPVGVHWLQAASVAVLSSGEARQIWAYRIPSLLGAALAAAALVWGAGAFFRPGVSLAAGIMLGASALLSTEAAIAKTDALLCGAVTLALAALARIYAAWRAGAAGGWQARLLFWLGLALAILDKGPVGPLIALLTIAALWVWDRGAPWARGLGWTWGLILIAAVVGPWAMAITVQTDGGYWSRAASSDLAPPLFGPHGRGLPIGALALLSPLLLFPFAGLLPAAAVGAWRDRASPGVRFALCWLAPVWLVFEVLPTRLGHYPLPLFPALCLLMAAALDAPSGIRVRFAGGLVSILVGLIWAGAAVTAAFTFGDVWAQGWSVAAAGLALGAGVAGAALGGERRWAALAVALAAGVAAHAVMIAGVAPRLTPLWLSKRVVELLSARRLNPRDGLIPGPVTVVGYTEPSLGFALGDAAELGDVGDAAEAVSEGRPVVVEARQDAAFRRELAGDRLKATPIGSVSGLDYSKGRPTTLIVYRSDSSPPATP